MSLFKEVIKNIENRKRKLERGEYNSIPHPFSKLRPYYQGIEKGKYEMVSALPKRGKTAFTDFMYVYNPVMFALSNESIDIKIHYLCLEMTKHQKMMQAMCHFLFVDSEGKINISPKELRSASKVLDDEIFDTVVKYEPFFNKYLDKVIYYDTIRNLKDITEVTERVCQEINPEDNLITELIIDHIGLVDGGANRKQAIDFISNQLFVKARNQYKLNPVVVQQQANEKDSLDAKKFNDLLPSFGGLADSKDTSRDVDMAFGVFSPSMAKVQNYSGINVGQYGDDLRIINIMGGREANGLVELPLLFNGATTYFKQM